MFNSQYYIEKDKNAMLETYNRYPVVIEKGRGATATDVDGKEYIDFAAGIAVNALGYADKAYVKAITKQAKKVGHICNLYYNPFIFTLQSKFAK